MLTDCIKKLIKHEDLSSFECSQALEEILLANNPEQIAAFLALMRAKGESLHELMAFVQVMQTHQISLDVGIPVLDIVGTGGDGANTANISTIASILAASCGVPVLKQGNRAASSQTGAADVLEALGLNLMQTPQQIIESVLKYKIGFCFAPQFHPALFKLKPIRAQLKIPTFFNLLGPLLNPGKAEYRILGVFDSALQLLMAEILIQLNVKRALIVHGHGLDELNCLGPCKVIEINQGTQQAYTIDPEALGFKKCVLTDLQGGDAKHNALLLEKIVENNSSHLAETAILNAAAAVYLYGQADTVRDAIPIVRQAIANGSAQNTLRNFIHA